MLDTFFFGYLELKWKRLVRVLSIGIITIVPFIPLAIDDAYLSELEALFLYIGLLVAVALLIGVVSWVLKPFIVKD